MQTLHSVIERRGPVSFPEFTGERIYMREFNPDRLPDSLLRWQATIEAMLAGVEHQGVAYFMCDQRQVPVGQMQRRPGLHLDGRWDPEAQSYGGGSGYSFAAGRPEGLLLASNVLGCVALCGEVAGVPGRGGDCSHLDVSQLQRVPLEPGVVWAGDAMQTLHESIPVNRPARRTVVRINVPGWIPAGVLV